MGRRGEEWRDKRVTGGGDRERWGLGDWGVNMDENRRKARERMLNLWDDGSYGEGKFVRGGRPKEGVGAAQWQEE